MILFLLTLHDSTGYKLTPEATLHIIIIVGSPTLQKQYHECH